MSETDNNDNGGAHERLADQAIDQAASGMKLAGMISFVAVLCGIVGVVVGFYGFVAWEGDSGSAWNRVEPDNTQASIFLIGGIQGLLMAVVLAGLAALVRNSSRSLGIQALALSD